MRHKFTYYYKEYKDCPEATAISEWRNRAKIWHYLWCSVILFMCLLFTFIDSADRWLAIVGDVLCVIWLLHLKFRYDAITEKQIRQAFKNKAEIKNSKYDCDYIKVLNDKKIGTCLSCRSQGVPLTLCEIKNIVGKRNVFICDNCIEKYKENNRTTL